MAWLGSLKAWFSAPAAYAAAPCYAALVAQARQPALYRQARVPDTPQGRFELVMLHAVLVIRRLHEQATFTQHLFDLMFADFDVNLRELGVGDLGVGKRVRGWSQAFKGRAVAYDQALADAEELTAVLARNIFAGRADAPGAVLLASYMQRAAAALAAQDELAIMAGNIDWPQVEETAP